MFFARCETIKSTLPSLTSYQNSVLMEIAEGNSCHGKSNDMCLSVALCIVMNTFVTFVAKHLHKQVFSVG